ncbi:hypothetical protein N431DRAFT_30837 [Stipitochalara longipes BDJ]|nr:hypothetical protein N431DRAFT_30837 [Stipitochalara longipes BDJ]
MRTMGTTKEHIKGESVKHAQFTTSFNTIFGPSIIPSPPRKLGEPRNNVEAGHMLPSKDKMDTCDKSAPSPDTTLNELDVLRAFKHFLTFLNTTPHFPSRNAPHVVSTVKVFLDGYTDALKDAAKSTSLRDDDNNLLSGHFVSWDEIIAVVKKNVMAEVLLKVLHEVNPDLKYKPSAEYPGLDAFANSHANLSIEQGQQVVDEMRALVPHAECLAITAGRVVKLKEGLLAAFLMDGLQIEYQLLRPFVIIGCRGLAAVDEQSINEEALFKVIIDASFDARAVVAAMAPFPNSDVKGKT